MLVYMCIFFTDFSLSDDGGDPLFRFLDFSDSKSVMDAVLSDNPSSEDTVRSVRVTCHKSGSSTTYSESTACSKSRTESKSTAHYKTGTSTKSTALSKSRTRSKTGTATTGSKSTALSKSGTRSRLGLLQLPVSLQLIPS